MIDISVRGLLATSFYHPRHAVHEAYKKQLRTLQEAFREGEEREEREEPASVRCTELV